MNTRLLKRHQTKVNVLKRIKEGIKIAKRNRRPDLVRELKHIALMDLGYLLK